MVKRKVEKSRDEVLDEAIESYSVGKLECVGFGQHMWRRLTITRRPGIITLHQRCGRCRKERAKDFNESMYPLDKWHYSKDEGNKWRGHGRMNVDDKSKVLLTFIAKVPIIEVDDET